MSDEIEVLRIVDTFEVGPDGIRADLLPIFDRLFAEGKIECVWQLTAKGNQVLCQHEYQKDWEEEQRGDYR